MRHRPRCWSREVTRRARDAASPPLLTGPETRAGTAGGTALVVHRLSRVRPPQRHLRRLRRTSCARSAVLAWLNVVENR